VHEPTTMDHLTEEARALHPAVHETHAERHGLQTFTLRTPLPMEEAGRRTGLSPNRLRYYDGIQHLEYEEVIEWAEIARYARGDKHYDITLRGLDGAE
jgi:hypothetical protein